MEGVIIKKMFASNFRSKSFYRCIIALRSAYILCRVDLTMTMDIYNPQLNKKYPFYIISIATII